MARLRCKCGEGMNTTSSPSIYILRIFDKKQVDEKLIQDDKISLFDFETSVEAPFEYWYCPQCKRVHIVEKGPEGKVNEVYIKPLVCEEAKLDDTYEVYIFSDTELYDAEEDCPTMTLSEFIEKTGADHLYRIGKDGENVYKQTDPEYGVCVYTKEK